MVILISFTASNCQWSWEWKKTHHLTWSMFVIVYPWQPLKAPLSELLCVLSSLPVTLHSVTSWDEQQIESSEWSAFVVDQADLRSKSCCSLQYCQLFTPDSHLLVSKVIRKLTYKNNTKCSSKHYNEIVGSWIY